MKPAPNRDDNPSRIVRATSISKTYHEPMWNVIGTWCVPWRESVFDVTIAEAEDAGLRPCKRCFR